MSLDFYLYFGENNEETEEERGYVFDRNITHNINKMATEAGIYKVLWHPEENGFNKAKQIISILEKGLKDMKERPEHYEQFNAPNGWGSYEHFVPWVEDVLKACKRYPEASIETST